MNEIRRRLLLVLPAWLTWRALPVASAPLRPPATVQFFAVANNQQLRAETDRLNVAAAHQFMDDAIRDMGTVMAQGKKYPVVEWPEGWEWNA